MTKAKRVDGGLLALGRRVQVFPELIERRVNSNDSTDFYFFPQNRRIFALKNQYLFATQ
jgi:hypothetical protein